MARQSAPSPQPILDAKEEIISLQQTLAAQEQALLHLKSVVSEKDRELDLLKVSPLLFLSCHCLNYAKYEGNCIGMLKAVM